jgi:hypothetical protein
MIEPGYIVYFRDDAEVLITRAPIDKERKNIDFIVVDEWKELPQSSKTPERQGRYTIFNKTDSDRVIAGWSDVTHVIPLDEMEVSDRHKKELYDFDSEP